MFVTVILPLLSPFAAAQSQSKLQLSPADLVKAVIHGGCAVWTFAEQ
jgi:hypothetical protein